MKATERIIWIDWMKTIGIYLIVVLHLFPVGYEYIAITAVPAFFVISGFLCRREEKMETFLKKLWTNIVIPVLILFAIQQVWYSVLDAIDGNFSLRRIISRLTMSGAGYMCHESCGVALGVLWYVYALIICKIALQLFQTKWQILLIAGCVAGSYWFRRWQSNSWADWLVAYPVFYIGYSVKPLTGYLKKMKVFSPYALSVLMASVILIYITKRLNGVAWMHSNEFGKSYSLFLIGGLSGTYILYWISNILAKMTSRIAITISTGTIIILGLHPIIIDIVEMLGKHTGQYESGSPTDYLTAVAIMTIMYFVILLCQHRIPFLLGRRSSRK